MELIVRNWEAEDWRGRTWLWGHVTWVLFGHCSWLAVWPTSSYLSGLPHLRNELIRCHGVTRNRWCLTYASYSTNIGLCLLRQSHSFFYWTLNQPLFFIISPRRKVRGKISGNYWKLSYSRSWYGSLLFVYFTDFYLFYFFAFS